MFTPYLFERVNGSIDEIVDDYFYLLVAAWEEGTSFDAVRELFEQPFVMICM